jgi:hypothetical protein
MTVSFENPPALAIRTQYSLCNDSMLMLVTAIRCDLSVDSTKTTKQVTKRVSDFVTLVNHLAKSFGTTPDSLTVKMVAENEAALLDYLAQSHLSSVSKKQIRVNRNTALRYARKFGFSPASFEILEEWEPILRAFPAERGAACIADHAIRRKRHTADFSEADLSAWATDTLNAGRGYTYVRDAQSAFLTTIRSRFQKRFPRLDVAVRKLPGYRLRFKHMPASVRAEITEIIDLRRAQAARGLSDMSPATERAIIEHFEDFCGYAFRVRRMDVASLRPLLNESFVEDFAFWLQDERGCKRTSVVGRLSRMFSTLKISGAFNEDYKWIHDVYGRMIKEPESGLKTRRRQRHIEFQDLAIIPARMRAERTALKDESPKTLGWQIHDELLLSCLILAQYPSRFVREAVLGQHIFKSSLPQGGPPFKTPQWAEELLRTDPDSEFWQFRYESSDGQLFRGLVLQNMIPMLELYLREYRPMLIGGRPDQGPVFFDRSGGVLTSYRLGQLVGNLTHRYTKKWVTPTAIRSSFAHYWRDKYPNKDAVLANIQWVQYPTIKLRYDEKFRQQRAARVARRNNPYT